MSLSKSSIKLCSCVRFGCNTFDSHDSFTGEIVRGQYLPISTWRRHQSKGYTDEGEELSNLGVGLEHLYRPRPRESQQTLENTISIGHQTGMEITNDKRNLEIEKAKLCKVQAMAMASILKIHKPPKLKFQETPLLEVAYPLFLATSAPAPLGELQKGLTPGDLENDLLISHHDSLVQLYDSMETIQTYEEPNLIAEKVDIQQMLRNGLGKLHAYMRDEWNRQANENNFILHSGPNSALVVHTTEYVSKYEVLSRARHATLVSTWLALVLHYLCHLSRERSNFVLRVIRCILLLTSQPSGTGDARDPFTNAIPADIRTAETIFGLEPILTKFMSCPDCRKLYKPDDIDPKEEKPQFCSYQEVSQGPECGARLWKVEYTQSSPRFVPRLTFVYQNFSYWLARFISRPGMETILRRPVLSVRGPSPSIIRDIWDGKVVHSFKDKEGQPFFDSYCGPELHLLFGFGYDNFNPFHNKAGRKKASVGAIYLICYNLPPEDRLRPENIYLVGIVPGPKQPSLTQLNHYMQPLVDELRDFYNLGFFFPSTADSPSGVISRGAVLPGIMDSHAARQMFALGSHQRKLFCTHCLLPHDNIDLIDPDHWPAWYSCQRHRALMDMWKNSLTQEGCDQIFEKTNLRWTILSRLPYFNMRTMCIIDPMHAFENLFRNIIENTWDMNSTEESGDGRFVGSRPSVKKPVTNREIYSERGDIDILKDTRRAPLWYLCERHELRRAGERVEPYRQTLLEFYRQSPVIFNNDLTHFRASPPEATIAGDKSTIRAIRVKLALLNDNNYIETKSWLRNQSQPHLHQICRERGLDYDRPDLCTTLAEKLLQNQRNNPLPLRSQDLTKGKPVLGRDEIEALNKDFTRMSLPSWVQTGPKVFNANSHGELSAAEWRTTVLIRLVVTLPRLWCSCGPHYISMLDNFMHLTNAVVIGSTRAVITRQPTSAGISTAELYRREYSKYLQGCVDLYPTRKLQPTEHIAYHLATQMEEFCPLSVTSTNALERCNGMLQDFPSNRRWSDLEETMMNKFCQGGNLKALTESSIFGPLFDTENNQSSAKAIREDSGKSLPNTDNTLQEVRSLFLQTFSFESGSMIRDIMDFSSPKYFSPQLPDLKIRRKWPITQPVMRLLVQYLSRKYPLRRFKVESDQTTNPAATVSLENKGWSLTECQYYGIWFRKAKPRLTPPMPGEYTHSHKDSHIWFQSAFSQDPIAGIITDIFAYQYFPDPTSISMEFDIYLTMRGFVPFNPEHSMHDPYQRYPISGGRLYQYKMEERAELICIKDVFCQLAVTIFNRGDLPGINSRCIHVLPLIWHHCFKPYDFSQF